MKPQILIASPTAGCGKTLFMIGLLRLLQKKGFKVQPFRSGADPIDPHYHNVVSERESANLDTWMASHTHLQYIYNHYADKADICVTEGNMGLFDGYHKMKGSSAELARILHLPVILIVNARATAYSMAALLYGFKHFRPSAHITGVIFNQVSSQAHYASLREACTDAGLDCLGYIPFSDELRMIQRRQSLTQAVRQTLSQLADSMAAYIEKHVDVDKMLELSVRIFPCPYTLPFTSDTEEEIINPFTARRAHIAIARDPAFGLAYRENIDRLAAQNSISYFSPLYSRNLPDADLIYLPGGFPESFARQLHRQKSLLADLREYAEEGGKILAEGSALAVLGRSLTARKGGTPYCMAGILPLDCIATESRQNTGYRRINAATITLKGYEFHHSGILQADIPPMDIPICSARGTIVATPMYRYKNVFAGHTHWYWGETNIMELWNEAPRY